ncbi:MAG: 1-acyl-sn-glycerol-3-phosphate acyltransferase [Firmicutes bacterium]|nr:1-acyl-sn-glycerol-3-phosphate acyltransferase [Bacillota bacterium]
MHKSDTNDEIFINKIPYKCRIRREKHYRNPKKMRGWIVLLSRIICAIALMPYKRTLVKVGMHEIEAKKTPYLLLVNHAQFLDFYITAKTLLPNKFNSIISYDGFGFNWVWPFLKLGGGIPKRRFINDPGIVKSIIHSLKKNKNICVVFPEAQYSPYGTTCTFPASVAKMVKMLKVPVSILMISGHHLNKPMWGDIIPRMEVPLLAVQSLLFTPEKIQELSVPEIYEKLQAAFKYNDYQYLQSNNIRLTYPRRAVGLQNILYKCPCCKSEFNMISYNANLQCFACKNEWHWDTSGKLVMLNGQAPFDNIPDWCEWERAEVLKEIKAGSYNITTDAELFTLPHPRKFRKIGKVSLKHDCSGFSVSGRYNKKEFKIIRTPSDDYTIQLEYNYLRLKRKHCFAFSMLDDSFYLAPTKSEHILKIYFAVEELHKLKNSPLR